VNRSDRPAAVLRAAVGTVTVAPPNDPHLHTAEQGIAEQDINRRKTGKEQAGNRRQNLFFPNVSRSASTA
jgi:hypothetical protein